LVALSKNFWTIVLDSVVIQLYAGEYTQSVDLALELRQDVLRYSNPDRLMAQSG